MSEIILDGIDVAGCYWKCKDGDCAMYYADLSSDNNEIVYGFNCEDNPECYYKQLQRAKAEIKKLKYYLNKIREDELYSMDVEWDEYMTECGSTEYTNVISFVELALGERDE